MFVCHDYKAPRRDHYAWVTTVGQQRVHNAHDKDGVDEEAFVAMREARDARLAAPLLLLPSIQVNIRAGRLPAPEANGVHYIKIPVKLEHYPRLCDRQDLTTPLTSSSVARLRPARPG
jgi:hypothetical protein